MIVGILGTGGDGGTFLDWTIQFLSGNSMFYTALVHRGTDRIEQFRSAKLLQNPLIPNKGIAHLHQKLHPDQLTLDKCIQLLQSTNNIECLSFYCVQSGGQSFKLQPVFVDEVTTRYEFVKFIVFFCTTENIQILVDRKIKTLNSTMLPMGEEIVDDTIKKTIIDLPSTPNRFMLNIEDMFCNLDTKIYDIFDYIGLEINRERFQEWKNIYKEWQYLLPKNSS